MPKQTRASTSGRGPQTAQTLLALIDALPPTERTRLFELLADHPDNVAVRRFKRAGRVLKGALRRLERIVRMANRLIKLKQRREALERLLLKTQYAKDLVASRSEAFEFADCAVNLAGQLLNSVPKRKMTPANQETLEHYLRLVRKHEGQRGAKTKALKELVTLPCEQRKRYVVKYKESCERHWAGVGDMEPVRQHLKRLWTTHRKRL